MKTQLRHLIILITLLTALLGAGKAWAVDVTGNVDAQTISSNTTWNVTGTINLRGKILIKSGATLTIQPKSGSTANRVIRRRNNWNGSMFEVEDGGSLVVKACTTNNTVYKMYFEGGASFTDNDARNYSGSGTAPSNYGTGVIIYANGNLTMTDAVVRYGYNPGAGAGICCHNGGSTGRTFKLTRVTIQACWAKDGSAVYFRGNDYHNATMTSCVIEKCNAVSDSSEGGSIRTNGGVKTSLTIDGCTIRNNHSHSYGAGIYWNAAGIASNKVTIKGATKIYGNAADANGGGVFIESRMDLQQAEIYSNTAERGAGIYFCTYGGGADTYDGNPFNASISSNVIIRDNHATAYGGGIYLAINKSSSIGYNPAGAAIDVEYKLTVDGGQIYGNYAPLGGGVAILDFAPKKVKYPINEVTHGSSSSTNLRLSGEYKRTITISSGSVYNNYNDGGSNYGGGFYIRKYKDSDIAETGTGTNVFSYQAVGGAGTMNVTLSGGNIYHNGINGTATTPTTAYGGAMFITDDMGNVSPFNSQCNVTVNNANAKIYQNQCTKNGGAIWLKNAVFTMSAGTIGGSTADANKTTGGHGGGFFITGEYSKVTVSGGNITYNTATAGNGGGFYVHQSSADGTTISGSAQVNYNQAKNGAGAFIASGKLTINGSGVAVSNNTASASGGGVYVSGGTVDVTSATIASNTAATHGGGIYSASGAVTLSSAKINSNTATNGNGGGLYAANSVTVTSSTLTGNIATNGTNGMGGGIYATGTNTTVSIDGTSSAKSLLTSNQARLGGGVYAAAKSVTVGYATIGDDGARNTASVDGGGIYAAGPVELNTGALIQCNTAATNGGGVYVNNGTFTMNAGTIGGSSATYANVATSGNGGGVYVTGNSSSVTVKGSVNYNTANNGNGGGIYAAGNSTTVTGGTITGNQAKNGGGIYAASGTVGLTTSTISSNVAATNDGGGIYGAGGNITVSGGSLASNRATSGNGGGIYTSSGVIIIQASGGTVPGMNDNRAKNGGAVYMNGGTCNITACNIGTTTANQASERGGGIFANGTVSFSTGNIHNNTATIDGGGIYISSTGALNISGTASISSNMVTDGQGGGVYQGGSMYADGPSLTVYNNNKGRDKNNVYLPNTKTIKVGPNITTSVNLGIFTQNIATVGNDIPVLTCDDGNQSKLSAIYSAMLTGTSNIRDDRNLHQPIYTGADATGKTLYFGFIEFDYPAFTSDFSNPIDSREKLYQFMCWVNGLNGYGYAHPGAEGNVTADIVADYNLWVPIGEANIIGITDPYNGDFHGNGHLISGLSLTDELYSHYGLFGTTQGANIDNVFVSDFTFHKNTPGAMGLLVGNMQGGTLENSTGAGSLTATVSDCIVGGLVGKLEQHNSTAGTIRSSYAGSNQTGYEMGGLVGELATGCNLYNSYANPSFTHSGSGTEYVGGLVAVNTGHIENCYVRLERAQSLGSARFGMLAGSNSGTNTIVQCYAPDKSASEFNLPSSYYYLYNNATTGLSNCNTFSKAIAPYLYYNDNDNLVTGTTTKLVNTLNTWVNSNSGQGYAPWRRTMAGGIAYSATAGDINGDYPVHQFANTNCVSASGTEALDIDYAPTLNAMLTRHNTNATINLYENDETDMATGNGVVVYIDEDVSLLQEDDTKDIVAFTNQTVPGNPRDWHFLSSSLEESYIGFSYAHDANFNWDPDPCGLSFSTADDYALFPSDMPAVDKMDLFSFYEPEYHWINFKRNSNSHWHMDGTTVQINYTNEDYLLAGVGYLVSIDKDQLLQNRGTLNNGRVETGVTRTLANAWAGYLGCNLLGNPYQSYLDFAQFASTNSGLWMGKGASERTYAVYDPQEKAYVQYKEGASRGAKTASGTLNMHQGFFVKVTSGATVKAVFNNNMRTNSPASGTHFRFDQPAYPLVNLAARDDEGHADIVVLEIGRDNEEGADKIEVSDTKGCLSLRHGDNNYGVLFRNDEVDYQSVWFDAREAGTFTMEWETANATFESLTLVDNVTGVETDMLTRNSYVFEANPDQYKSRFKIVFGEWKDVDENSDEPTNSASFAFMMGDELIVNGEGTLQLFDVTGRLLMERELSGTQTSMALPAASNGIYMLRLSNRNGMKTQKIVLR